MQPSASKAQLLLDCPYPFNLANLPPGEVGEAAVYGTRFHKAIEELIHGRYEPRDPELSAHVHNAYEKLTAWLEDKGWPKEDWWVEIAFSYCPRTANSRTIPGPTESTHTYEDLRDDEIAGTADLIIVPQDKSRAILVLDHKTGMWGDFSRPERLPQLLVLGTAACLHFGRDRFVPAILHTPRGGTPIVYSGDELSLADVAEFNVKLKAALSLVGAGYMRPGSHCRYCPAKTVCPTQNANLLEKAGELVEKATMVGSELVLVSNDNQLAKEERVGRLHLMMARFSELKERAQAEIKREVKANPDLEFVRPDGKQLVIRTKKVERLSKKSILQAYGAVEGAKVLDKLREDGALVENEEEALVAE